VALLAEREAHMVASAVESDAFHDQQELHQADLDGDDPKCYVLLDLPGGRAVKSAQPGNKPESLFTYQFLKLCKACGLFHPNYTRNSSSYFMRSFIGPRFEILTHHRRSLPPPTTFYHNDVFRLSLHAMNDTIYGHHSEGIYLSPLAVLLVNGAPDWGVNFRFRGWDGMREWKLLVRAKEVHITLTSVIWICGASGDEYASLTIDSTDNVDDRAYKGFIGDTPHLEVNHSLYPFPIWPNFKPKNHSLCQ
jgi:hypothetical protein